MKSFSQVLKNSMTFSYQLILCKYTSVNFILYIIIILCNILSEFESYDCTVGYMTSACILQLHNELCSLQWHSEAHTFAKAAWSRIKQN